MLKIKDGFVMRNICDEWIIIPVGQREISDTYIMSLNETGHFLWEMLEKGTTEEELLKCMLEEYNVDATTAKNDIHAFIDLLQSHGIM